MVTVSTVLPVPPVQYMVKVHTPAVIVCAGRAVHAQVVMVPPASARDPVGARWRWRCDGPKARLARAEQPLPQHAQPAQVMDLVCDAPRLRRAEPRPLFLSDESLQGCPTLERDKREREHER